MAVDKWPYYWPIQIQNTPSVNYARRTNETKFGNGFSQISEDGPNAETRTFTITFTGQTNEKWTNPLDVSKFLRAHIVQPFDFTPPDGERGLFRVVADSVSISNASRLVATVTATITTAAGWQS